MSDTRAQLVALQLAFDSLAAFIDENDGIRASYMEELGMSYCRCPQSSVQVDENLG